MITVHERPDGEPVFEIHPTTGIVWISCPALRKYSCVNLETGDYIHFRLHAKVMTIDIARDRCQPPPLPTSYVTGAGRHEEYVYCENCQLPTSLSKHCENCGANRDPY